MYVEVGRHYFALKQPAENAQACLEYETEVADRDAMHCAAAHRREIAEETGLDIKTSDLLVIDWVPPEGDRPRVMTNYIFDGGTIDDPSAIRLQDQELDDARFWTWEKPKRRCPPTPQPASPPLARHAA